MAVSSDAIPNRFQVLRIVPFHAIQGGFVGNYRVKLSAFLPARTIHKTDTKKCRRSLTYIKSNIDFWT